MQQELTAQEVWSLILEECGKRMTRQTVSTWLKPGKAVSLLQDALTIELKNKFCSFYVEQNYQKLLNEVTSEILKRPFEVRFVYQPQDEDQIDLWDLSSPVGESQEGLPESARKNSKKTASSDSEATSGTGYQGPGGYCQNSRLNPRYTFENFVVGKNNQFAHAAALNVAQSLASRYNPLFIYGGVGLGKTHIMQAIGNKLLEERGHQKLKVCYVSAEEFLNQLINALTAGTTTKFRSRYRQIDVLLMDDVEFLSKKESTQEELFHTFNTLYESQRQIVLTSDRPPREIRLIEERLRSRFQCGLVADIQPPEFETRIAILKKKSEIDNLIIPENVLEFIAENIKSNVRLLEGSLLCLQAHSNIKKTEINLELAENVLKNIFDQEINHISVENIINHVSLSFRVPEESLRSPKRIKSLVEPRQVAMYLCKRLTKLSTTEIAQRFNRKDHTTVIYSCKKVFSRLENDMDFQIKVQEIINNLKC